MSVSEKKETFAKSSWKLKSDADKLKLLEEQIRFLRKKIESMKKKVSTENAIERAVFRGVSALGGKYKVLVPEESGLNGSCCSEELPEKDTSTTSSTLSVTETRKKNPFQVNEESELICPDENNSSVCSSNEESEMKKNEKCGNYQLG